MLSAKLPNPPKAGSGIHDYILKYSRKLVLEGGMEGKEIEERLFRLCSHCDRPSHILGKEIHDAVTGALKWAGKAIDVNGNIVRSGGERKRTGAEWLPLNAEKQSSVVSNSLYSYKSLIWDKDSRVREFSYEALFARVNFPICCAIQMNRPVILPLEEWLRMEGSVEA